MGRQFISQFWARAERDSPSRPHDVAAFLLCSCVPVLTFLLVALAFSRRVKHGACRSQDRHGRLGEHNHPH